MTAVPYASATSGAAARAEISKILQRFGCSSVGFMDDYEAKEVVLAFTHRGRNVQLRASARGWAAMYLAANPWTPRRRNSRAQYEADALNQGLVAVNSILRDWIKGQVTAVECGVLSFSAVFMPHMLSHEGKTLIELVEERGLLPAPHADGQD
ncbi:hypothetical protein [Afifella aestuarii]|uniref:hypothetical protein n=1 Tax=Afifella aestuarii TaxID=1909496 RepID=UPI000FE3F728|nr:hypothetical protein [Afifella aestuarii]